MIDTVTMYKFLGVIVFLLSSPFSQAWGPLGHKVICDIAWRASETSTRNYLSAAAKRMGYRTFADSCIWPDQVRKYSKYDYLKPMHYMNLDRSDTAAFQSRCLPTDASMIGVTKPRCVMTAIPYYLKRLADTSLKQHQRDMALLLVGHFMGDLHQPLHVSYADDLGGNQRRVIFSGRILSLHQIWDTHILLCDYRGGWKTLGKYLYDRGFHDTSHVTADDMVKWADESFQITRELYRELPKRLPDNYCDKYSAVAINRLHQAGFRLGQLLHTTLVSH